MDSEIREDSTQYLLPVRGIVLAQNGDDVPLPVTDVKRWMRLNAEVFKAEKIDVLTARLDRAFLEELAEEAEALDVRISLRIDCSTPPDKHVLDAKYRWWDILLTPLTEDTPHLDAWLAAAEAAALPIRLQLTAPFAEGLDVGQMVARVRASGAKVVNIAACDPFIERPVCSNANGAGQVVGQMNELAKELAEKGIEVNLLHLPFCLAAQDVLPFVMNTQQLTMDYQHYLATAYRFAAMAVKRPVGQIAKAVLAAMGRNVSTTQFIDNKLLPWYLEGPFRHMLLLAWRKLTRPLRIIRRRPKPLDETESYYLREIEREQARQAKNMGPICAQCSVRRICDHGKPDFLRVFPQIELVPQPGDVVTGAMHFTAPRKRWFDPIDESRRHSAEHTAALEKKANEIVTNQPPTREIDSMDYRIEGQYTHQMPGGNRWYSFTNTEKVSTILARVSPPFTLSTTFGGGIAEFIGFCFGRHCKLVCPMEAHTHRLILHVDAEGRYVMLRDGRVVRPIEFEGTSYVPSRLPGILEPRILIANIDGAIVTQTVLLWEGAEGVHEDLSRIDFSVLIVCTRYSRRLQIVLESLVNQRDFHLARLEVILCYVPGLDPTEDVIESFHLAHPELRIVRVPFSQSFARAKGFLINEAVEAVSGKWVVLLDADTVVSPEMFHAMDGVGDDVHFVAPDGRKMLDPRTTARILLGEITPWDHWDELLAADGEFRLREAQGVPIGFCQAVRRECLDEVRYIEMDHFEGADWMFGYSIRKKFGQELRLSGVPVLHLDHGGSQWYGTAKHR